jgi:small-conductance mechanosensitive channel
MKTYFILAEDQYALGDWIQVGSFSGEVVRLSLRHTQIRSASGDLHTLGNGMINEITNFTHRQSGLNLLIDVSYNTDLDQAMAVMTQVARGMGEDPLLEAIRSLKSR